MELAFVVGNVALVCTVLANFAGLPVCLAMVSEKSTAGVSSLPFITAAICTSLWLQYGWTTGDSVVTLVNLIAVFTQISYLACFYYWASFTQKTTLQLCVPSAAVFVASAYLYSSYAASREAGIHALGLLASGASIIAYAAPMAGIVDVFRSQSTKGLPFLIIFSSFIVTLLWYVYGMLIGDPFIKVPNLIGALLSGFQLSLFALFDSHSSKGSTD